MSRIVLHIEAVLFRMVQSLNTYLDLYFSLPRPQKVAFKRRIPSTISTTPGNIDTLFYTPPSYTDPSNIKNQTSSKTSKKHPLLINFHGGGFTIGHARDDARWATAVTQTTEAVVASIEYRLAPRHPFPIGIEDCVSAILYLWSHAEELNLDISRTSFSGFSAGGNFCLSVAIRLREELDRLVREGKPVPEGKLVSLAVFYGSVDYTLSRVERDASNPNLIRVIPLWGFKVFDSSYLPSKEIDRSSPLLSPGVAPEEVLRNAIPGSVFMVDCGGDQLLAEQKRFEERLKGLGKKVDSWVVDGVGHGWDKKPSWKKGEKKRDDAYEKMLGSLREAWA